jgi:hypothetical protein
LQVLVTEIGRIGCEAVSKCLLGLLGGLSHGRSTECPALRELGGKLRDRILVIRVRRVLIGLGNNLIEIAATSVGVATGVDVVCAPKDAVQGVLLGPTALCAQPGIA